MANELSNYIVDVPIHTKIADIEKKMSELPKEKLVERIQATTTELVKLQYMMREYSVYEWYEKLGEKQKELHDFFENRASDIKNTVDKKYNWVVLSDREIESSVNIKDIKKYSKDDDIWIGFLTNSKKVEKAVKEFTELRLKGMLFVPLFSVSK